MATSVEFTDLGEPFVQIPNSLMRDSTLSAGAKVVYAILRGYAGGNPEQIAWPSQATLAFEAGFNKKTVRKYLDELEERKLITPIRYSTQETNRYQVHPPSEKTIMRPKVRIDHKGFTAALCARLPVDGVIAADVIQCLVSGGNKAASKAVVDYLVQVDAWQAIEYLQGAGLRYRAIALLLRHLGFQPPSYDRTKVLEWIKSQPQTKEGNGRVAEFLFSYSQEILEKVVLPGFTPAELQKLRAHYKEYLLPLCPKTEG